MSHLENFEAVIRGKIETSVKPTLSTPLLGLFAGLKKQLGGLILLFAGALVLASCGGTATSSTTATYPNATLLVSGSALNVSATNQVIIDTRSATLYNAGHITNAINLAPSALDTTATSTEINTPSAAAAVLGAAGISNTAKIIVYGADVDSNAGRLFWALEYLGAADVHILDGGYAKWVADARTVVTTATTLPAAAFTPAVNATRLATKADVVAHYADTTNYAIIDSRNYSTPAAIPAYLNNSYTTAHIPNAVNILTGDFLNTDKTVRSYADIKTLLDSKGVTTGKTVITHCYVGQRSAQEYFMLRLMGFTVSNYDGSWTEWAADSTLPTETSLLVSGAALNVNAANQVIIDTRAASAYAAGHISGAINLSPTALDTTPTSFELNAASGVAAVLGAAGISNSTNIILYGDDVDANVGRMFWALEYLGAGTYTGEGTVFVLDGGYAKWVADGRTVVTTATTLPATTFTAPAVVAARLSSKADVVAHYTDTANYAIIDSRNYSDASSPPNNYVTAHIPNAVSILMADFLNSDKTVKSYADLRALLNSKGVTAGKTAITHCYVGYRSGQEYLVLRRMGFKVSNYDGSWTEWAADPTPLPVNTGSAP
jgi:thiosulfate/3-mercaptopyruvate sulfurtransferase